LTTQDTSAEELQANKQVALIQGSLKTEVATLDKGIEFSTWRSNGWTPDDIVFRKGDHSVTVILEKNTQNRWSPKYLGTVTVKIPRRDRTIVYRQPKNQPWDFKKFAQAVVDELTFLIDRSNQWDRKELEMKALRDFVEDLNSQVGEGRGNRIITDDGSYPQLSLYKRLSQDQWRRIVAIVDENE